jgi:hypothetical protein
MERCFACDLGFVRIHTGPLAAASAAAVGAKAYAAAPHVAFAAGQYRPDTLSGRWLIAHELAHLVGQHARPSVEVVGLGDPGDPSEQAADRVANTVQRGRPVCGRWLARAGRAGLVQCHLGEPCPPWQDTSASLPEIYIPANAVIEAAYRDDPAHKGHAVLYGSQFEYGGKLEIALPRGAPWQAFANAMLAELRGISRQLAPDIIDFTDRAIYEIKTIRFAAAGIRQLTAYYALANAIAVKYNQPTWTRDLAGWYPPHVLPLPGDVAKVVCTAETDYTRFVPGLIFYRVLVPPGADDEDKAKAQVQIVPVVVDREIAEQLPNFQPSLSRVGQGALPGTEYVIIAPTYFYQGIKARQKMQLMQVNPPFLDQQTTVGAANRAMLVILTIYAFGVLTSAVVVPAGTLLAGAVPAAAVGTGAGAGGGGASVTSLAAFRALQASVQAQELAKAAGVIFVLGTVSAAGGDAQARAEHIAAVRAVPTYSLAPGVPLGLGQEVQFDGDTYSVFGKAVAR